MKNQEALLQKALKLSVTERAELVEELLKSLDEPDPEIDKLWKKVSEERIDAYEKEKIEAVSVEEAISKYKTEE